MRQVGSVEALWRYPVSSLGGERLSVAILEAPGVQGDRGWAVVDCETGQPAAPEKEERWRPALFLSSRLKDGCVEIGFPDATWLPVDHPAMDQRLRRHFGFDATVRPYATQARADHPLAPATNRYEPLPLHLVTTGALDHLARALPSAEMDSRRFRPNLVLRTSETPRPPEAEWLGARLRIGSAIVCVSEETRRCGMTLLAQPGLSECPDILRHVVRQNRRNFGVYCRIETPASMEVGDPVFLCGEDSDSA